LGVWRAGLLVGGIRKNKAMKEYNKIYSPFVRDNVTNRLKKGEWSRPEFEYIKDQVWYGTEKIDGTNIRVIWDGENVIIGGKTDNAQLPMDLVTTLQSQFDTTPQRRLFAEKFGENKVCFYGEGYGAGIQKGGVYRPDKGFILFDIMINYQWLGHGAVVGLAEAFGCSLVPTVVTGTLEECIDFVETNPQSTFGDFTMEGIVARPAHVLLTGRGERIMTKIKVRDFVIK